MKSLIFCTTAILAVLVHGDDTLKPILSGSCPEYAPMADLDLSKISGIWYSAEYSLVGIESKETEKEFSCASNTITVQNDNSLKCDITIKESGKEKSFTVIAKPEGNKNGKFSSTIEGKTLPKGFKENIYVIDTDYDNYGLELKCLSTEDGQAKHGYMVGIVTRNKEGLDKASKDKLKEKIKALKVDANDYIAVNNQNC